MGIAYEQNLTPINVPANADLSASQFCAVSINSSGNIALTAAAAAADGILQDKPAAAGRPGSVASCPGQICTAKLGTGGATKGDLLEVVGTGGGLTTQTSGKIVAKALQTGLVGDFIPVLLILQR